MSKRVCCPLRSLELSVVLVALVSGLNARTTDEAIPIGNDDIGGVVQSTKGPEGGVWVIAETTDFPTKFVKIVVTDDRQPNTTRPSIGFLSCKCRIKARSPARDLKATAFRRT